MASRSTETGPSELSVSSSLYGSLKAPAVFVSHSDKEKPFVQCLYDALLKVNHNSFFDKYSLPKDELFPQRIITAARACTLGVVVLSDDFLTSKWAMIELEILVQQWGSGTLVLPLFYKLSPEDCKSPEKLSEWHMKWEKLARNHEEVVEWHKALRCLVGINGFIFIQGTRETEFIRRVVDFICKEAPWPPPYDMSEIRGHDRLAEEVAKQFDHVRHERQDGEACMVGLSGVGGVGKSTVCKSLVNFYWSEYRGKSHYLELPTNGSNMEIIVQECKQALKALADLDQELLKKVCHLDQVIQLMKEHLERHDVFLAIDNVSESSWEVAERILKVGFRSESKILVTSRSERVLKDLFGGHKSSHVSPLPALNREEAFEIFKDVAGLGSFEILVRESHFVDIALERCKFCDTYNALALRALGLYVKKSCAPGDLGNLSRILGEFKRSDLSKRVEDMIRRSYDSLEKQKQLIFLDIAVLPAMRGAFGRITVKKVNQWLSLLYKDPSTGEANKNLESIIDELCWDGFLQPETIGVTGERIVKVHDLHLELAKSEVARSSRFFIAGRSSCAVEEIQWQELERVILDGLCDLQFIEKLQWQTCRSLQVLDASGVGFSLGIDMRLMPSLCVLKFCDVSLRSIQNWAASEALVILDWQDVRFQQPPRGRIPSIFHHWEVMSLKDVAALQMPAMKGVEGLKTLQYLRLVKCNALKGMLDLSDLSSSLKDVQIQECGALERVPGLSGLTCLEKLDISDCESLMGIPDLRGLASLDRLILSGNSSMMKVGGLSSSLRDVQIRDCEALERVPDMSGLTCLVKLEISECESLKVIPDLSCLASLDWLILSDNGSMEKVGSLSSSLRAVRIELCNALKEVPDMSELTRLESLEISYCKSLKRIPDLSSLATLDQLILWGNKSMKEVGGLSSSLRVVEIHRCRALKKVPDMSGLPHLERLMLSGNEALEEVEGQFVCSNPTNVCIMDCPRLVVLPERLERELRNLRRTPRLRFDSQMLQERPGPFLLQ